MERRNDWSIWNVHPLGLVMVCDEGPKGIRTSSVKVVKNEPELTVRSVSPTQTITVLEGSGVSRADYSAVLANYLEIFGLSIDDAIKMELADLDTTSEVYIPFKPSF